MSFLNISSICYYFGKIIEKNCGSNSIKWKGYSSSVITDNHILLYSPLKLFFRKNFVKSMHLVAKNTVYLLAVFTKFSKKYSVHCTLYCRNYRKSLSKKFRESNSYTKEISRNLFFSVKENFSFFQLQYTVENEKFSLTKKYFVKPTVL